MPAYANSITVDVFVVGTDPDDAQQSAPFTDLTAACRHAAREQRGDDGPLRVYRTTAVLDLSTLTLVDDPGDDPVGDLGDLGPAADGASALDAGQSPVAGGDR